MRLTSNTTLKIKGSDPLSRKKAKHFFDYLKLWDEKELFEARTELQKTLPVNKGYSEHHYVGEAFEMLEKAQFVKVIDTVAWGLSYEPTPKRYFLWAHPSGVLCSASTYDYKPNESVEHQKLNDMHIYTHMNLGFSNAGYCASLHLSSASGGGHMGKTGESHHRRQKSISSSSELIRELVDIQSAGRIVPFHEQNMNEVSMYLSAQMLLPISQWKDGFSDITATISRREMFEHLKAHNQYYGERFWENLLDTATAANTVFPSLGDVIAVSMYHCAASNGLNEKMEARAELNCGIEKNAHKYGVTENYNNARSNHTGHWLGPHLDAKTILHYIYVEAASQFIGRIHEHSQQRYSHPQDIQLIEHWMHELKHHRTGVNWNNIDTSRTTSEGISVVHLCLAMDSANYTEHQNGEIVSLAQQAIEHTPVSVLTTLCTSPLPDGNTLPLMALDQYLRMHMEMYPRQRVLKDKFEEVMHALHQKVPAPQWNCGNEDGNTVDGVWLQALCLSHFKNTTPYPKKQLEALLEPWRNWGCELADHTTLCFPLRRIARTDYRLEFRSASKIHHCSLEDAFSRIMSEENPSEDARQKMLNSFLTEIVGDLAVAAKRKM